MPLTPDDQEKMELLRQMIRTWSLETQAKVLWLRMVNTGDVDPRTPYTEGVASILAVLETMAEVEI